MGFSIRTSLLLFLFTPAHILHRSDRIEWNEAQERARGGGSPMTTDSKYILCPLYFRNNILSFMFSGIIEYYIAQFHYDLSFLDTRALTCDLQKYMS